MLMLKKSVDASEMLHYIFRNTAVLLQKEPSITADFSKLHTIQCIINTHYFISIQLHIDRVHLKTVIYPC